MSTTFSTNLINEAVSNPDAWSSRVYDIFMNSYGLDPKDVSDFVDDAIRTGEYTRVSTDRYVQNTADRIGLLRVEGQAAKSVLENDEEADKEVEKDIFENYILFSVNRPGLSKEMNESIFEGVKKSYLSRKGVQVKVFEVKWGDVSDRVVQVTSENIVALKSIVKRLQEDRYITSYTHAGILESHHYDETGKVPFNEGITAIDGFLRMRSRQFPNKTVKLL